MMRSSDRRLHVVMNLGMMPVFATWAEAAREVADVTTIALVRPGRPRPVADLTIQLPRRPLSRLTARFVDHLDARRILAALGELPPIDLLHGHFYAGARHLPEVSRALGIPYVVTEHSTAFTGANPTKHMTRDRRRTARRVFDAAAAVLPVSASLGRQIEAATGTTTPITVIHNPGDAARFAPGPGPGSTGARTTDGLRVVCVARLHPVKNQARLIEAVAAARGSVPEIQLDIVGAGDTLDDLRGLAERLGVSDRVHFRGRLDSDAVADLLRQAHVFALPSFTENCSVAIIEALLTGLPVLASDAGGNPELVDDSSGVLLDPTDTVAWTDALVDLATGRCGFDRTAIRERAADRFSVASRGAALEQVYRRVRTESA
jgi:glycosyltransferase involved in cell wall biosynthesis